MNGVNIESTSVKLIEKFQRKNRIIDVDLEHKDLGTMFLLTLHYFCDHATFQFTSDSQRT